MGDDSDTWSGEISLCDVNLCGVLLLDFFASYSLLITNTMIEHMGVHQCTWPHCRLEDDDRLCHCFIGSPAICLEYSGKERV